MALTDCPECGKQVSEKAPACPHCGVPIAGVWGMWGWEYKSKATLFGLPLVHVIRGPAFDPRTGRLRVAKGIVAVGGLAAGVFAFGGLAFGIVAFGGLALGLVALGGLAVGLGLAGGGLAIGSVAFGGAAIGYYAFGGGAWGAYAFGGNARDPGAIEFFRRWGIDLPGRR